MTTASLKKKLLKVIDDIENQQLLEAAYVLLSNQTKRYAVTYQRRDSTYRGQ